MRRRLALTFARSTTLRRDCSRAIRSRYRLRTRVSSDSSLCRFGSGRIAFEAMRHSFTMIDSSPRRLVMTSPATNTWSPRSTSSFHSARDSSPTSASETMAWMRLPSPDCRVAKQSLPVLREYTTRPARPTCSPLASSTPRLTKRSRTSGIVAVIGRRTGYAPRPRSSDAAIRRSRLASRTAFCSEISSALISSAVGSAAASVWVSAIVHSRFAETCVHQPTCARLRGSRERMPPAAARGQAPPTSTNALSMSRVEPTIPATSTSARPRKSSVIGRNVSGSTTTK